MNDTRWTFPGSSGTRAEGILMALIKTMLRITIPRSWRNIKRQGLIFVQRRIRHFDQRRIRHFNTNIRKQLQESRRQRDIFKTEEEKTEALLLNILPQFVAAELRATGAVQPLACNEVTVCFTDFVGFTLSSEKLEACDLVAALHRYFAKFDEIIAKYGLEKLKTIGDSYMFVSGLPEAKPSHAVDAVLAALEIVEAVENLSDSAPGWSIRVGIHSGPVVAGVVGTRKFAFDIWGETVNLASRHESSGHPNRVNISARTYELVRDHIHCDARGPVQTKEGRSLEMYFARSCRASELKTYTASLCWQPALQNQPYEANENVA
jgi:class 3 adenylate cyclase